MSRTYREFIDSREAFISEPSPKDWREYERYLDGERQAVDPNRLFAECAVLESQLTPELLVV